MSLSAAQEPRWLRVAGGRMPVWTRGAGPPVLLLHGISADHSEWAAVAAGLGVDHRVVLPDLLGRGASFPSDGAEFGLFDEVARLELLMDALGLERPVVAGHSHGAALAVALACRRPVAGLLLASPVTPWTVRPAPLALLRYAPVRRVVEPLLRTCRVPLTRYILTRRVYGRDGPDVGDAVRRYAAPYADPARGRALLRVFRDWRPADLERLSPPPALEIRVLTGAVDRRISPVQARRWAERLGAGFELVEGAGHGLTEEAPERVEAALRDMAAGRRRKPEPRD